MTKIRVKESSVMNRSDKPEDEHLYAMCLERDSESNELVWVQKLIERPNLYLDGIPNEVR